MQYLDNGSDGLVACEDSNPDPDNESMQLLDAVGKCTTCYK